MDATYPVPGCWVVRRDDEKKRPGRISVVSPEESGPVATVHWFENNKVSRIPLRELISGFRLGMDVMAVHSSNGIKLGEGVIKQARTVGQSEQMLVEFNECHTRRWIPYQFLCQIQGVRHGWMTLKTGDDEQAEKLRLRILAQALTVWNENTGALSSLDIDPLPHQIHLVHHIINSGNLNWMIADDVGLGKTIEAGMLLAALRHRGLAKRVLLITPAGLTKQWQDEMHDKFGLSEFRIYGDDFTINEPRHWKMYDNVIASVDRLKQDTHLEMLLQADSWDLVIFDEAHRLSRRLYGLKYEASGRFELAAELRRYHKAQAILLLTATPHQGMQDKFAALLELLRPERKRDIEMLNLQPELLNEMVIRNYKADVTDVEGNFVFHGKSTHAMTVPVNEEAKVFDQALQRYLKQGYSAGQSRGRTGNAIGFVMTVYRKLASSSVAAIQRALQRRLARLQEELRAESMLASFHIEDERYQGEYEEHYVGRAEIGRNEFFEGEIGLLQELIADTDILLANDMKLELFLRELLEQILTKNPEEKVLIFSEYRATQDYLREALATIYGSNKVNLLHGGMNQYERTEEIRQFENEGQFLISTEAGGEGINLHHNCHIMVNYDLPWNPMRLVQRIGRLYRYGQKNKVVVFNIQSPDTVDEQVIGLMYDRIAQAVKDLAAVQGDEFNESLKDDILGELCDLVEVKEILDAASNTDIERTQDRIDEALSRARESASKQRELFQHAAGFNPNALSNQLVITTTHVQSFVTGMCRVLGIEITERTHKGHIWHLRLPDAVMTRLATRRSRVAITFDRMTARNRPNTVMMDMNAQLMTLMIAETKTPRFKGRTSAVIGQAGLGQAFMAGLLRWQNDLGLRMKQEFGAFTVNEGKVRNNPTILGQWLLEPARHAPVQPSQELSESVLKLCDFSAQRVLSDKATHSLFPEQVEWVGAAWVGTALLGNTF